MLLSGVNDNLENLIPRKLMNENEEIIFEDEDEAVSGKLKKLRDDLALCRKEKEEYLAGWQRAKADFINARKEEEKNRAEMLKFSKTEALLEMLPVADSFQMAFADKEAWEKADKNWRIGVEYIYTQFISIFENNGLKQIDPLGEIFNPNIHTSIRSVNAVKKEDDNKIVAVIQKGYSMGGNIIRSPKVEVAIWEEKNS